MIISVASGKGGTGKTLVATNLALSLAGENQIQLLDCDVEEPNAHIFLMPSISQSKPVYISIPQIDDEKCTHCRKCAEVCEFNAIAVIKDKVLVFPELCHGCGACSYLCPDDAIKEIGREIGVVETGDAKGIDFVHGKLNIGQAMAPPVIREVKRHIRPDRTNIIDVAPGTSCPVVEAVKGSDFCILVTEPTPFGLNDLILAVEMVREVGIPCGIVLNRTGIGDNKTEGYCLREDIPILLQIPLDTDIARLCSQGIPLVDGNSNWRETFLKLFHDIKAIASNGKRQ